MTARQQAIHDIKAELHSLDKCFIAYNTRLNPVMRKLVKNQIKLQESL